MYRHQNLRINYTSYDLCRSQDTLNPRKNSDIMLQSHDDDADRTIESRLYWYARILSIFHVNAWYNSPLSNNTSPVRVDLLRVCWFGHDPSTRYRSGRQYHRLHRIGFVPDDDPDAFGFVHPNEVIQAVHLIPAFADGQTHVLLPNEQSLGRKPGQDKDWHFFYVNQ
jgi:hypothetical protein